MAAKVLSWSPYQHQHQHQHLHQNGPSFPSCNPWKAARDVTQQKQPRGRSSAKKRLVVVRASLPESLMSSSPAPLVHTPSTSLFLLAADTAGYSSASYYTSLGLFVISVPGLWSLIKRSVKSKVSNPPTSLSMTLSLSFLIVLPYKFTTNICDFRLCRRHLLVKRTRHQINSLVKFSLSSLATILWSPIEERPSRKPYPLALFHL